MTLWFNIWKNIFNSNKTKEEFLPNALNDKINKNSIIIKNIKNNIYNQVKTIIQQLKVSNEIIIALLQTKTNTPIAPQLQPQPQPQLQPQPQYDNLNTGYTYLDGYNSTMYENYNLYNCPSNTFGCINKGSNKEDYKSSNKEDYKGSNKEEEDNINKLMTFNKDYIRLVLTTLEDNIYNMHQNIFDLEGKDNSQLELNTYHLEMLIYTQFLFKKLEKNVSNPIELNIMLINILKKISEQL